MTDRLVVPGEELGEGEAGDNVYSRDGRLYSERYGFLKEGEGISVIPVSGRYVQEEGDQVVGVIEEVSHSSWDVDINSPYQAILHINRIDMEFDQGQLGDYMSPGDSVRALVDEVDWGVDGPDVELSLECRRCGLLREGRVIEVEPVRVPRLIGHGGDMVGSIRSITGAEVFVGNNGRVWINGDEESVRLAASAVEFVAENAHKTDLKEKVEKFLEQSK